MILLAFDGSTVYQIKAKANAAPKEHLWRYVDWFLENMGAERFAETGKYSDDGIGFAEMIGYLRNKHEGQINFGSNWNTTAIELLNQYEGTKDLLSARRYGSRRTSRGSVISPRVVDRQGHHR